MESPISSMSKSKVLSKPKSFKNFLNFSCPTFCAILTDPILPDLIKICSAVKSDGILSSYSPIRNLLQYIFFLSFLNSVSGSINPSFKPAAYVNVLNTDPIHKLLWLLY